MDFPQLGRAPQVRPSRRAPLAIVEGLESAGVRRRDIVVFDRYKDQFLQSGYKDHLPDGCRWDWAVDTYDEPQLDIARYDPDVFATLEIVQ